MEPAKARLTGREGAGADGRPRRLFRLLLALYVLGGFAAALWVAWRMTHGELLPDAPVTGRWATLDWLTNYQGGFIRRGLAGEFILRVATFAHLAPTDLVFGIVAIAYAAQAAFMYGLFRETPDASAALLVIFAPFMLGFELLTPGGVARKDVVFIALLAGLAFVHARRKPGEAALAPEIGLGVLAVLVLVHEAFFLYSPYVLAFGLVEATTRARLVRLAGLWALSALAFGAVLLNHGSAEAVARICQSLGPRIAAPGFDAACTSGGAINALALGAGQGWAHFRETYAAQTLLTFTPALLLILVAFLPLAPFLDRLRQHRRPVFNTLVATTGAALVLSLPLFVVADDWGRWIRIHGVAIGLCLTALMARGQKDGDATANGPENVIFRRSAYLFFAVLYAAMWELNIVGGLIGGGFFGRALGVVV